MDCSGAGTGENNNIPLSFFFLASLNSLLRYVLYSGKALVDSTLVGLVDSTLQTLHLLMTFWTLTLNFGTHKLSLALAIVVAVPRCMS